MKLLKKSTRKNPKISLVLLDWSVRESFHLLHYLEKQTLDRDLFEVIIVEYYSTVSSVITPFEAQVDTWCLLEMPESHYYHKHVMYNAGILYANGEIVIICDSDAMVKPSFLQTVITHFEEHPESVLHLDQFRNNRRNFYPFNYPAFEQVTGEGCVNYVNGKTTGITTTKDPLHYRNYGACFCAKREDLIAIGGSDEHVDFVGYICGPYDLTLRLINLGRKEIWHETEFLYHTWHPGQAGDDNYFGPHDGRHFSITSLIALLTRNKQPHLKNSTIKKLQEGISCDEFIMDPEINKMTSLDFLKSKEIGIYAENQYQNFLYEGFLIKKQNKKYEYYPLINGLMGCVYSPIEAFSLSEAKYRIIKKLPLHFLHAYSLKMMTVFYQIREAIREQKKKRQLVSGVNENNKISKVANYSLMLKKKRHQFRQLCLEIAWLNRSSRDLMINLILFFKNQGANKKIQVWVCDAREIRLLKIMFFLKAFPVFDVICFSSPDKMLEHFEQAAQRNQAIFISRNLYFRYVNLMAPYLADSAVGVF